MTGVVSVACQGFLVREAYRDCQSGFFFFFSFFKMQLYAVYTFDSKIKIV